MSLFGPKWPLSRGERDTYELFKTKKEQISFHFKNLLLTSPGENISDPNYGVGLRLFLFEMNTFDTHELIKQRIFKQASFYLAGVTIVDINIIATGAEIDENYINIKITYEIDDMIEEFDLDLNSSTTGFY